MVDVPARKAIGRIGVDQLAINVFGQAKVFVTAAIGKVHFQGLRLVLKIHQLRSGDHFGVLLQLLLVRFGGDAHQQVIGFNNRFALFFRLELGLGVILNFVGMPVLHKIPVNGFQFLQVNGFVNPEKFSGFNYSFHCGRKNKLFRQVAKAHFWHCN